MPGRIALRVDENDSRDQVFDYLSRLFESEGFEDLGRYDEMIESISRQSLPVDLKEKQLARLRREYTYLNDERGFRVVVTDYSATDLTSVELPYGDPFDAFLEIAIYEWRPGGFSPGGHTFFRAVSERLRTTYANEFVVVAEPPATNESEYRRITAINVVSSILAWGVALALSLALIGSLTYFLIGRLRISRVTKQITFALSCAWLVTPVPLPATIVAVPGPNIFLFPWVDLSYYEHFSQFIAVSFAVTLLICSAIALRGFRGSHSNQNGRSTEA